MITEERLKTLITDVIAVVDEGMFNRKQKIQVLREVRGRLLTINQLVHKPEPLPPPNGKDAA
jgi:hypothetical protein